MEISIAKLAKAHLEQIMEHQAEALTDERPVKLVRDAAAQLKEKDRASNGKEGDGA